ncbi:MAG: XcyI family restriction endonuclease [Moorellaceae bacterium]
MNDFIPTKQLWVINRLRSERGKLLREALKEAVQKVGIQAIDEELHELVDNNALTHLGSFGLRGEMLFPVPCLIKVKPTVSGYYRLVLGISQKEYARKGLGKWVRIEQGENVTVSASEIRELCMTLIKAGEQLLNLIVSKNDIADNISEDFFHELALLTFGAQLDGSYRVIIGKKAVDVMRHIIREIVTSKNPVGFQERKNEIQFTNAAGRQVRIRFGSDPDILASEYSGDSSRQLLAIEVKGGGDPSNIHNRLGEAEKSHLKLSAEGVLRWTIVGVPIDERTARMRSPSTNRFFALSTLLIHEGQEYQSFRRELISILGLPE